MVPPCFTAFSQKQPHCCAVRSFCVRLQPDAVTGAPVAGLRLMPFAHAAPRPFSAPCIPPAFTLPGSLWGPMRKPTLLITAYLPMLGIKYRTGGYLSRCFGHFPTRSGSGTRVGFPPAFSGFGPAGQRRPAGAFLQAAGVRKKAPQPDKAAGRMPESRLTSFCGWPSCAARGSGSACGCADSRG